MHTHRDQLMFQEAIDYEHRAHILNGHLIEQIGEPAAEEWFTTMFPDGTIMTWRMFSAALDSKLMELNEARLHAEEETEAEHRMDIENQRYAGAN